MPFIAQCPHCQKFMLFEDPCRGTVVECLLCKKSIQTPPAAGASPSPALRGASAPVPRPNPVPAPNAAAAKGSAPPSPTPKSTNPNPAGGLLPPVRNRIHQCPKCRTALEIPANFAAQAIQCPKCNHVFSL